MCVCVCGGEGGGEGGISVQILCSKIKYFLRAKEVVLMKSFIVDILFVERVHYEEHLQARMFAVWKENTKKAVVAHSVAS